MRFRFAMWAFRRWAAPRLVGYIGRKGNEVYMMSPEQVEVIFHGE